MRWLIAYERRERRRKRAQASGYVRAYRKRKKAEGARRVEATLTREQYQALLACIIPGETMGTTLGRLIDQARRVTG